MDEQLDLEMTSGDESGGVRIIVTPPSPARESDEARRAHQEEEKLETQEGYDGPSGLQEYSLHVCRTLKFYKDRLHGLNNDVKNAEITAMNAVAKYAHKIKSTQNDSMMLEAKIQDMESVVVDGAVTQLHPKGLLWPLNFSSGQHGSASNKPFSYRKGIEHSEEYLDISASLHELGDQLNTLEGATSPDSKRQTPSKRRAAKNARHRQKGREKAAARNATLGEVAEEAGDQLGQMYKQPTKRGRKVDSQGRFYNDKDFQKEEKAGAEKGGPRKTPRRITTDVYAGGGKWVHSTSKTLSDDTSSSIWLGGEVASNEDIGYVAHLGEAFDGAQKETTAGGFSFNDLAFRMK